MTEFVNEKEKMVRDGLTAEQLKEKEQQEKTDEAERAFTRVVKGQNDIFEKEYSFGPEYDNLKFTVKFHAPTALENGQISALAIRYLGGMQEFMPEETYNDYYIFALLFVCWEGKKDKSDLPDVLHAEKAYTTYFANYIKRDIQDFLNSFRY